MTMSAQDHRPGEPPLLELLKVSKQYPGVLALDAMNFTLRRGEVHVLFGENGAGKSTLISVISGATRPTSGDMLMNGEPARFTTVHEARAQGVTTVFQEFSVVPSLSVEENLFLGSELSCGGFLAKRRMRQEAHAILQRLGFDLDPRATVARLTRAEQQMVEIARAFRSKLSVLILDEPTASLTDREANRLFELVDQVKAQGVGIIYITHRMHEIDRLADRITVLRDGKFIATVDARDVGQDELVGLMTGRVVGQVFPNIACRPGRAVLSIDRLATGSGSVKGASLQVRAGELVGLAGLVGSGKSEIFRAAFGLERTTGGTVTFEGKDVTNASPRRLLRAGFSYMPPDRRVEGLAMMRPCSENMTLSALDLKPLAEGPFLNRYREAAEARRHAATLELHPMRPERAVEAFSGGNQQKVLLARSLTRPFSLYVFDEPTVGVDVGTRAAIYRFIGRLCEAGAAVIVISSDLPEILNLSHRAYVFYDGRVQAELTRPNITEAAILPLLFGQKAA